MRIKATHHRDSSKAIPCKMAESGIGSWASRDKPKRHSIYMSIEILKYLLVGGGRRLRQSRVIWMIRWKVDLCGCWSRRRNSLASGYLEISWSWTICAHVPVSKQYRRNFDQLLDVRRACHAFIMKQPQRQMLWTKHTTTLSQKQYLFLSGQD